MFDVLPDMLTHEARSTGTRLRAEAAIVTAKGNEVIACMLLAGACFGGCLHPVRSDLDSNSFLGFLLRIRGLLSRALYVSTTGSDSNSGTSASEPLATLERAITLFSREDYSRINVAAGTFPTNVSVPDNANVQTLTIAGGYDSSFAERKPFSTKTLFSPPAGIAGPITVTGQTVVLQGVHAMGGTVGSLTYAVRVQTGELTVTYSHLEGNTAATDAVALSVEGGKATVRHSLLEGAGGGAGYAAGVFVNGGATVTLENNILFQKVAPSNNSRGVVFQSTATGSSIKHTTINLATNFAPGNATGIFYSTGAPTMINNILDIAGTSANAVNGPGGSIDFSCLRSAGGAELAGAVTGSSNQSATNPNLVVGPANHFNAGFYIMSGGFCQNVGSGAAASFTLSDGTNMANLTTETSLAADSGTLDVGFHYPRSLTDLFSLE